MSTSDPAPPSSSSGIVGKLLAAAIAVAVAAGLYSFWPQIESSVLGSSGKAGESNPDLVTAPVKEGMFESILSVQGNLESQSNATLTSQVEGSTTIISIVPEGTLVKEGQIVCELDSSELTEELKQQEIDVTQAEAKLAQAREELEIQERQNESDIAAAQLEYELAELDLEKYDKGEYPASQKELAGKVALAEEEFLRAEDQYAYTKRLVEKGYKTPSDLEGDRISVKGKRLELDQAREELKVLTEYTRKREIAELTANALEFKRELERTKLKAKSAYAQAKAELDSATLTLEVEKEKLERYRRQLEACVLRAPQDGEVVYATESSSRGRSEGAAIEEGASVRERQAIINLPDVTRMQVDCKIHESLIGNVRVGLPAVIRVDAFPDRVFNGEVSTVSSVPMSGSWPNYDLREYALKIALTDSPEVVKLLRPGLTSQVSIIADRRENVLQVPLQAVVKAGRETLSFVESAAGNVQRRLVSIGGTNTSAVEITDGLSEGEKVVLNPRTHFGSEIAEVERASRAVSDEDDAEEIEAAEKAPAADGGNKGTASKGGGPGGGGFDPKAIVSRLDKDGDGKISKDEAPGQMASRFDAMDKDADGYVTAAEFGAAARGGRPQN